MSLRIDLTTLQLFTAVIDEQSIAKAAEKKHIAVSAVSRRISELEAALQVELLFRHSKGIEPTPAGLALLDHARTVIGQVVQLETELLEYSEGTRGLIRLHANKSALVESLAEDLAVFMASHPMVKVEIEERISPDIVAAIFENRSDLGIFGGNIPAPELEIHPYREDRLVAIVWADHPLASRPSVRFSDMLDSDFVCLEKGSSIETLCVLASIQHGRQLRQRIRVSGFDALFKLVEAGLGVGIVPSEISAGRFLSPRLAMVPLDETWARRALVVGVRRQESLPPAARLLLEHLRATAGEQSVCHRLPYSPDALVGSEHRS